MLVSRNPMAEDMEEAVDTIKVEIVEIIRSITRISITKTMRKERLKVEIRDHNKSIGKKMRTPTYTNSIMLQDHNMIGR